ncbi:MAG: single-stranded DNA-binding protein [Oceanicaulis sp.]|uniref:single-stranded DNA-binding protein n=1 Tax=Glycocaulis sp. TaxID=1969725 RepID=UPI0025C63C6C|nr:single-stranded DNA-binding protein [Glycocaulis sp.]MCC5982678.1 single-stranded DNA-binding protein [Oceanicaulis sp.]MCH8522392.1 single-stranded DNA-binding protein [Glycocaulis sp.]
MNKFIISGNLGADADIRERERNGETRRQAFIRVCVESYTGQKDGQPTYRKDWFSVAVFNQGLVNYLEKHGKKGAFVLVEGEMEQRRVDDTREAAVETLMRVTQSTGSIELVNRAS